VSVQLHVCCVPGERTPGTQQLGLKVGLDAVKKTVISIAARN
jgi:hypothetical protein